MRRIAVAAVVALGSGCGGSGGGTSRPAPGAAPSRPAAVAGPTAVCVSPKVAARTKGVEVYPFADGAVICASTGHTAPTCWRLAGDGKLYAHAPSPELERHVGRRDADSKIEVESTSGTHKAVLEDSIITIIDLATNKPAASVDLSKAQPGGVSATVTVMYFVGDTLFVIDSDAGPHEDVIAYGIDGRLRGTVWPEVYGGTVSILGPHRIAFAVADTSSLGIYDVRTHKLTKHARTPPATPACTKNMLSDLDVELEGVSNCNDQQEATLARCCKQLRAVYRWQGAHIVPLAGGKLGLIPRGAGFTDVGVYDPATGSVSTRFNLGCTTVLTR